jgi:gamma-glutamylcyclotransferase (GGCT)/AIG2-like uncharacterized protein YtfP
VTTAEYADRAANEAADQKRADFDALVADLEAKRVPLDYEIQDFKECATEGERDEAMEEILDGLDATRTASWGGETDYAECYDVDAAKLAAVRAWQEVTEYVAHVFVYGSLKRGWGNWSWALKDDASFVGEATVDGLALYGVAWFPGAVYEDDGAARGEVFQVTAKTLDALDGLEGYRVETPEHSMYRREIVTARLDNGDLLAVQTYIWNGRRGVEDATRLPNDTWPAPEEEK